MKVDYINLHRTSSLLPGHKTSMSKIMHVLALSREDRPWLALSFASSCIEHSCYCYVGSASVVNVATCFNLVQKAVVFDRCTTLLKIFVHSVCYTHACNHVE